MRIESNALVFQTHLGITSIDGNTELYGVGENNYGELAIKTTNVIKKFTKIPTEFPSRVKQVSCSYFDTSVLLEDGKIFSTGQIYGSGLRR
jgi:alpha-tubulin suppressor-like RCC1 family protein